MPSIPFYRSLQITDLLGQTAPPEPQYAPPDSMYPYSNQNSYGSGSEGANLEYSILSAILGNSPDSQPVGSPTTSQAAPPASFSTPPSAANLVTARWPAETYNASSQQSAGYPSNAGAGPSNYAEQAQLAVQPSSSNTPLANPALASEYGGYPSGSGFTPGQGSPPSINVQGQQAPAAYGDYAAPSAAQASPSSPTQRFAPYSQRSGISIPGVMRPERGTAWASQPGVGSGTTLASGGHGAGVYQAVTKPYDYTEGYHFLMKHLPTRFEKNDILRIVRALAIFRPSLIALQMPLSEEDEVFVEKCFQRSLIELDKLVSFSGTPTVAWRRTGEICLVGPEFCMLTGWEKEELVGRRKYIYELFENQSVVEYWENFANHAFENTTQSVYSHCVLLKPSGAPVPCTFCFSIKRDIMDLPSLVIGQWLPLI
ncbi:hypothetical protein DAEQUDRAFT_156630 [Daedalea quercina L-15889]|uniref:PAS domain-containing protein n=1 Tax=Daedalea quercina L-15889 TaxID=1314783 RepID=A0A165RPQ9_9APHY|nr:hypothetical protein DAEQUDRAFT_156630 [Daedalea quercina L-15889]